MNLKKTSGFLLLLLTGCSSISIHDPIAKSQKETLELSYCVSSSSDIATIKEAISNQENKEEFNKNIHLAINDINNKLRSSIKHTSNFHIIASPECINNSQTQNHTADLYLEVDLSGYGSLKTKWKNFLIGTGIAEGIFQGIIVGAATANPWIGVVVGAEEITSEYLTWNGVDWIFGEAFAPVTLEGKLTYIKNDDIIWKDVAFVTENESVLTDIEKKDKSLQLLASLHKAEDKLISSLNNYLQNEIIENLNSRTQQP